MTIKQANVAGQFYPGNKEELSQLIEEYLHEAEIKNYANLKGIIAPHAGYIYSGKTAACGYKQFANLKSNDWKVFILAPSHFAYIEGVSVGNFESYETPLGNVPIHQEVIGKLLESPPFYFQKNAFAREHSLEVQIPFIQSVLKDFQIIPLIFGETDHQYVADKLDEVIDDKSLLIVSSDLSHFHDYDTAKELDTDCIESILNQDTRKMETKEACGKGPILTLLHLAKIRNWKFELIDYRNSGDITGDTASVVGYSSIAILE